MFLNSPLWRNFVLNFSCSFCISRSVVYRSNTLIVHTMGSYNTIMIIAIVFFLPFSKSLLSLSEYAYVPLLQNTELMFLVNCLPWLSYNQFRAQSTRKLSCTSHMEKNGSCPRTAGKLPSLYSGVYAEFPNWLYTSNHLSVLKI